MRLRTRPARAPFRRVPGSRLEHAAARSLGIPSSYHGTWACPWAAAEPSWAGAKRKGLFEETGKMIVAYVSGHGFGHATRVGEVLREVREREPGIPLAVVTSGPEALYQEAIAGAFDFRT
jgi:hypothetical protein